MLITPEVDRHNCRYAIVVASCIAFCACMLGFVDPPLLLSLALAPLGYWLVRRPCLRRHAAARRPFPNEWQSILERRVRFYEGLEDTDRERFRQMVNVFLDEVQITGIRTEVDDTIRVLVAASAIIPIFGFTDFHYHRLGEVLIYPASFDQDYHTDTAEEPNILGLTGLGHLRGVVVLSKPSLLAGFAETPGKENVGVHEFAHLVEQEEIESGLPVEVPPEAVRQWVEFVGRELKHPSNHSSGINDYGYTNEHEFFAVLSEYFFGSPETLKAKNPALYDLLRKLFHQDPAALTSHLPRQRHRVRRNDPCPCGSGKKFKECCLHRSKGATAGAPIMTPAAK